MFSITVRESKGATIFLMVCAAFLVPDIAFAGAAGAMPYDVPLDNLVGSLTGPVAQAAGVLAILFFGLGLAFSDGGGMMRKAIAILFGLSIAFAAVTWGLGFFGFTGGLVV